jgi:hypothetical protein
MRHQTHGLKTNLMKVKPPSQPQTPTHTLERRTRELLYMVPTRVSLPDEADTFPCCRLHMPPT